MAVRVPRENKPFWCERKNPKYSQPVLQYMEKCNIKCVCTCELLPVFLSRWGHVFHWCCHLQCGLLSIPVLVLRLRCCLLLQWLHTGLVLSGVGRCNTGMPGYAIRPAAEWLLVRHQPLLLKLHHQFWSCVSYTNGVDSLLAWAGDGDAWEAWFWWVDDHWKLLKQIRGVV